MSFSPTTEDKVNTTVSSSNLTLTNFVGSGKKIFPTKGKSLSSESLDHPNDFIVLLRNPSVHDRSRASGSKQIKIGETRSCADKTSLSENLCPESIHSETVVTENV